MAGLTTLAFDTSSDYLSAALLYRDKLEEQSEHLPRRHQERLLPLIDLLLKKQGIGINEVERIAVGIGPGSYTGLRIGVTTARALAQATGAMLSPVSSTRAIAANFASSGKAVAVVLDGKNGEYYFSAYGPGETQPVTASDAVMASEEVTAAARKLARTKKGLIITGDAFISLPGLFEVEHAEIEDDFSVSAPRAGTLIRFASRLAAVPLPDVKPLYLRVSYAEKNRA